MNHVPALLSSDWVSQAPFPALLLDRQRVVYASSPLGTVFAENLHQPALQAVFDKADSQIFPALQVVGVQGGERGIVYYDVSVSLTTQGYLVVAKDVSLEHNLRSALMESRLRFKDLVEISSDFAWEVDAKGCFNFVSQRNPLGYDPDDLIGTPCDDIVLQRDSQRDNNPFLSKIRLEREEVWVLRPNGQPACLMVSCMPLFDASNTWNGARGVCRDITEERERDAALARAYHRDQLLAYIVKTIRDEVEPSNMLSAAATATARALGANGCQIYRLDEQEKLHSDASFGEEGCGFDDLLDRLNDLGENAVGTTQEGPQACLFVATRYRRTINGAICLWRDQVRGHWSDDDKILIVDVANQLGIANEQISGHERILKLSRTDALTGLLNRRAFFEEELPRHIDRLHYNKAPAALIYVDLDHFKQVNDAFGHQKGDEVLLLLREFLLRHVRPGDKIARLGGDEFAMWLDNIDAETAHKRCSIILDDSKFLQEHSGAEDKPLGVSVGLALFDPTSGEDVEGLISRADAAMYKAKRAGRGQFCLADPYDTSLEEGLQSHDA